MYRILIVDDDSGHLTTLKTIIKSWGHSAETAQDGSEAVERIQAGPVDMVLMDVRMAIMGGIEALKRIKAFNPAIPVVIMTAYSSVESAVQALKAGAYDYLIKPLDFEVLKLTIDRACEHAGLKEENQQLKARLGENFNALKIIGTSSAMKHLMDMLAMIAPTEATVLICGESGTGKELIARAIHGNSPRKDHPLVVVNCAAISESLLESELFGHEKGAFTGAERAREGRFQQADGGTVFLDEIGETSPAMQTRLLRVIQEREIEKVGGGRPIPVDVRIVAATNRDLAHEVETGRFREDLFYRLNVVTLEVPPLRQRAEDIPLLAQHFLTLFADKNRKKVKNFTPQAMDLLMRYPWPGNVRELENAVERAVILLSGDYITERHLPVAVSQHGEPDEHGEPGEGHAAATPSGLDLAVQEGSLEDIERQVILAALERCGGNKSEAARRLGITRKTLHNKLKQYGVQESTTTREAGGLDARS